MTPNTADKPMVSVIIPTYRAPELLFDTVRALVILERIRPGDMEVIIQYDPTSGDLKLNELLELSDCVSVERNSKRLGFGGSCNAGVDRSKGDFLFFLNQDCYPVSVDWLTPIINTIMQDPMAGIVCPKLVFPWKHHGAGRIQSCGGLFDNEKGPFHRYLGEQNIFHPRVNTTREVSWATGAALFMFRDDFEAAGRFDPIYGRGYFEDVDLCMRMRFILEKTIWYCAETLFHHHVGSTWDGSDNQFGKNSAIFHERWDDYIVPDVEEKKVDY